MSPVLILGTLWHTKTGFKSLLAIEIFLESQSIPMNELKLKVQELFEHDKQMRLFEKEVKVKRGYYHHLILKNSEKVYSDEEVIAINKAYQELTQLESQRSAFSNKFNEIKNFLKSQLAPLDGGKWVHITDDLMHPKWEFWVEDEELKYARLNGINY